MLYRRCNPQFLDTIDITRGHLPSQQGVFGKGLEIAATERVSVRAYCGREKAVGAFCHCFFSEGIANLARQGDVPGGGEGGGRGEAGGGRATAEGGTAGAVGAVGNLLLRDLVCMNGWGDVWITLRDGTFFSGYS